MNRATWIFCKMVLRLDRIPRYGRIYKLTRQRDGWVTGPAEWVWQKHGRWGLNLLDRLGLMWRYVDEYERRDGVDSGTTR